MGNCIGAPQRGELETANADLEKACATAQQELESSEARQHVSEIETAQLKQRNADLQQRCESLEAEYQKRLAERVSQLGDKDDELRTQQERLDVMSQERDQAKEKVRQLEVRIVELVAENKTVARQLETAQADVVTASKLTRDDIAKLRTDFVNESQRNMAELCERMNSIQETSREELAQAKAMSLLESAAAKKASKALSELQAAATKQHDDDVLKLEATLRKLTACELQFDESFAQCRAAQASLAVAESQVADLSEELKTTKAALSNANAAHGWSVSDVDWTERDYHDRPHKFSHHTTRKEFTVSYKWWGASQDYCVDIREWYWNPARRQMERTTKGVFLPLPTAQELSRILPEVVRQAKVVQMRSPKGSTND